MTIATSTTTTQSFRSPQRLTRSKRRRAAASLEFLLFLPMLTALLVGLLTVVWSSLVKTDSLVEARTQAWNKRHAVPRSSLLRSDITYPDATQSLLRGSGFSPAALLRHNIDEPVELPSEQTARVRTQHFMLGNTFDFRTLKFQKEPDHPRLLPDGLMSHVVASRFNVSFLSNASRLFTASGSWVARAWQRVLDFVS